MSDQERLEWILARLEDDDRDWLVDRLDPPWRRRRRRVERRDQALRDLAVRKFAAALTVTSGHAMAAAICKDLKRYAASAFRFDCDRPLADPQRALWWQILKFSEGGRPPSPIVRRGPERYTVPSTARTRIGLGCPKFDRLLEQVVARFVVAISPTRARG